MDLPRLVAGLPVGVSVVVGPRGLLVVREGFEQAFVEAGYGPDDRPHPAPADAIGKRPLGEVRGPQGICLVRRFHHGGVLRWLTGERFAGPARPFEEWRLQERLAAQGVLSPRVTAARAVRARPWGWLLDLATERVPRAEDLGRLLARRRDGDFDDRRWRRLLTATGRLVARLHALGFEHADLTPRNLLADTASLDSPTPRLWVIDLDGSRFAERPLTEARCRANLARLDRHLQRMAREHGAALTRADRWRFLAAYTPERAARRRLARALERAPGGLHRLGWVAERLLGRGRGRAEAHLGRRARH